MGMTNKYGLPATQSLGTLSGITTAADAEERKKRRQAAYQTPGLQGAFPPPMAPAPTFAKMQQNGEARPAPPGYGVQFPPASPMNQGPTDQMAPIVPFPEQDTLPARVSSAIAGNQTDDELLQQHSMLRTLGRVLGLTPTGY